MTSERYEKNEHFNKTCEYCGKSVFVFWNYGDNNHTICLSCATRIEDRKTSLLKSERMIEIYEKYVLSVRSEFQQIIDSIWQKEIKFSKNSKIRNAVWFYTFWFVLLLIAIFIKWIFVFLVVYTPIAVLAGIRGWRAETETELFIFDINKKIV